MALIKNVHCLVLLCLGLAEARQAQYGLATVDEFCQGYGDLDQLGDIAAEVMNSKFPGIGSVRVSKVEMIDEMLNVEQSQVF